MKTKREKNNNSSFAMNSLAYPSLAFIISSYPTHESFGFKPQLLRLFKITKQEKLTSCILTYI